MELDESKTGMADFIEEVAQLTQSDLAVSDFYAEVAGRLIETIRAARVSVYAASSSTFRIISTSGQVADAWPEAERFQIYDSVLQTGDVRLCLPNADDGEVKNPTDHLRAFCPVTDGETSFTVIDIGLGARSNLPHAELHEVLTVLSDLAATFHRTQELIELRRDRGWWEMLDQFVRDIHASIRPDAVAYTIVNEGRRIVGCDRLTLLLARGHSFRVEAISGMESVNRRSNNVRQLEQFCVIWLPLGESLRYPCDVEQFPEDVRQSLLDTVHESGSRNLHVIPLLESDATQSSDERRKSIGALVVENFAGEPSSEEKTDAVARHVQRAVRNAREYQSVFLFPLWSAIGKLGWMMRLRSLPRTIAALLVVVVVVMSLIFVETDFYITAEGSLQPDIQRHVFAPHDGVVENLVVNHGDVVKVGSGLLTLRSSELDLKLEEVGGELRTVTRKIAAINAARNDSADDSLTRARFNQMVAEEEELIEWQGSLKEQKALLLKQKESLDIQCPVSGEIITPNLAELLKSRPVTRGQALMTIAVLDGGWHLQLHVPDRRIGHIQQARANESDNLQLEFIVVTEPDATLHGEVREYDLATSIDDREEALGLGLTADIDDETLPELVPGARVSAKIHCGRRSLGFVWFHDVAEFVQREILFRLF